MYMVQIEEKKIDKLSEHIEESLRHMGKAMQCVDEWMEEGGFGHGNRGGMGYRNEGGRYGGGSYGYRYPMTGGMGYRDEEEWEDDDMIGERRGRRQRRDSRGRYM